MFFSRCFLSRGLTRTRVILLPFFFYRIIPRILKPILVITHLTLVTHA